ncbi:G-protein coupled receptor 183-like [Anguilla rostrata]|uniref:G-protein coupled receptor 183-like n=1 Tax=Anguilla rostrata TaxID=7938 RepID=UPI0030CED8FF
MENLSVAESEGNNQTLPILNSCDRSSFGQIVLPVSYSILFLFSLAGNVSLLFYYFRKEKSSSKLFIANLAALDLLMALTLPLVTDYRLQGSIWRFGDALCTACVAVFYGNLYGGSLFMLCIASDRLVAVRFPEAYGRWTTRHHFRRLVCVCVWIIITTLFPWVSVSLRPLIRQPDGHLTCGDTFSDEQWLWLPMILVLGTVVGFLLPYAAIVACYALIARELTTSTKARQRWKSRSLRAIVTLIAIMTVCFLPFHTVQMVNAVHRLTTGPGKGASSGICFGHRSLVFLASMNSALDPFVCYYLSYSLKINRLCQWR